jgi:hypothetical protein
MEASMGERSMGSEFDRKRVDGDGEQRRQQNEQSNQAGGQQGSSGGSLGAGPMTSARDAGMERGTFDETAGDGDRDPNHQPRDLKRSLEQRSMGEGPRGAERDSRVGAMSRDNQQAQGRNPGPGNEGLAEQVNHGLAQADPQKSVGPQRVEQAGNDAPVERGGTANRPGDANGSGSMGSTRRDDPPRAPQR